MILLATALSAFAAPVGAAPVWQTAGGNWENGQIGGFDSVCNDGDAVTFGNTGVGTVNIIGTVAPLTTLFNHTSGTYTTAGGTLAGGSITISGAGGTTSIATSTSVSHTDTFVNAGRLDFNSAATTGNVSFGSGTITLNGGRFQFNQSGGNPSSVTLTNAIVVGSNGGTLSTPSSTGKTYAFSGALSLGGHLTFNNPDGGGGGGPGGVYSGTVTIDQASAGLRQITLSAGGNHGPLISGNIVDGAGAAANPLVLRFVDSSNARSPVIAGTANTYSGGTIIAAGSTTNANYAVEVDAASVLGTGNVVVQGSGKLRFRAGSNVASGKTVTVERGGSFGLSFAPTDADIARYNILGGVTAAGLPTTVELVGNSAVATGLSSASAAALVVPNGQLVLDSFNGTTFPNRWGDAEDMNLSSTRLRIRGRNATGPFSETIGDLTFAGGSNVVLERNNNNGGVRLVASSLNAPAAGSSLLLQTANLNDFGTPSSNAINALTITGTKPAATNGMISPGIQHYIGANNLADFVTFSGNDVVLATPTYVTYGGDFATAGSTEIVNYTAATTSTLSGAGTLNIHALRVSSSGDLNLGTRTVALGSGGLIMTSRTISNGTIDFGSGAGFIGAYNGAAQAVISAGITGSGGLTVLGTSQALKLNGNALNTFTGGLFITGGSVGLSTNGANLNDVTVNAFGRLMPSDSSHSATIGGLIGSGRVTAFFQGNSTTSGTITITNAASTTSTFDGVITNGDAGRVLNLAKTGTGTQVLGPSVVANYTGTTTVSAGTLRVNGAVAGTGNVSVASGATLGGSGSLGGATTVSGILSPGNSIGTLTVLNDVTWNGGATAGASTDWDYELGPASASDLLAIQGASSDFLKGTGSAFRFDFNGSTATGTFTLVDWQSNASLGGGALGTSFNLADFSYTNLGGGNAGAFSFDGTSLVFTVTPIPEPGVLTASLAMMVLTTLRRRR